MFVHPNTFSVGSFILHPETRAFRAIMLTAVITG